MSLSTGFSSESFQWKDRKVVVERDGKAKKKTESFRPE
jgi:hypothetical protein